MNARNQLLIMLAASLLLQVLLFPGSGLETRSSSQFTQSQLVFDAVLGVVIFILNIAAFPLLWRYPVWGLRTTIVFAWLALLFGLADISALLGPSPPPGFATVEGALSALSVLIVIFAYSRRKRLLPAPAQAPPA